ncbi:MAG: isoleucine--tRNA ligase, partial [SAR202 cluster bacterium Io17-Chloro-G9]
YWKEWFPAELITESFPGQFRGWFYSLLVMSTALENTEPFRNLHSYATMRDERGEEMHKSKGNAIWFEDGAEKMGVDSMRWLYSRHNPAANLNFGFGIADEVRRRFIIPLWNVYSFFVTYANIDGYDPQAPAPPIERRPELDRWILSELAELTLDMTSALDVYEVEVATRRAEGFVEQLSNWYVRRSRRRFWKSDADEDKQAAYATLYECLVTLTRLIAPIIPFVSETMFRNLAGSADGGPESVHLESYPVADKALVDRRLSQAVRLAMRLSSLGRAARSNVGVKVRQPMAEALVKLRSADEEELLEQISSQVGEELNVRRVSVLGDEREVAEIEVKADMSRIGPRFGRETRDVLAALSKADPSEVYAAVAAGGSVAVGDYVLEPEDIVITSSAIAGYSVVSEGGYSVAVTTEITPELELEGRARELVHLVQNMRRSAGFDIADHVVTYYDGDEALDEVVAVHGDYIRQETLSRELTRGTPPQGSYSEEQKVNGLGVVLGVVRD